MTSIEDIIRRLNSEDCELSTTLCLREYKERDCWVCILKEYTNKVYNKALDDFIQEITNRKPSDEVALSLKYLVGKTKR